jgi:hypothetical protein
MRTRHGAGIVILNFRKEIHWLESKAISTGKRGANLGKLSVEYAAS